MTTPRLMGAEVKRKEDPRLITGRASYVTDVVLPGMHHVAFVRSPHAHARIRRIDASAATRRPGVFTRSEEHTSELQSQSNLVCRLLLEKKKTNTNITHNDQDAIRRLLR